MEQYIPKSALVAEIKKRKGMCDNHYGDYWNGCYNTFTDILSFLDTLEVKEVECGGNNRSPASEIDTDTCWDDGNF